MQSPTEMERSKFLLKTTIKSACLLWQGKPDKDGYGTAYFRGMSRRAHRVAWFLFRGGIPKGMLVDHTCRNRSCVNHQHLKLKNARQNVMENSTNLAYLNSQKTHCKMGHPLDGEAVWGGKRQRFCSICQNEKSRRLKKKWRSENTINV